MLNKVFLTLTKTCNLGCVYCLQGNWQGSPGCASIEPIEEKLLVSKFPSGRYEVLFYGGEPFLEYDRMIRLGNRIKEHNPEIVLATISNGTLLTIARAKELNALGVHVTISHDGYNFAKTRRTTDYLQVNPEPYLNLERRAISATASRINYDFYDVWDYFLEFQLKHGLDYRESCRISLVEDAGGFTDESLLIRDMPEFERMLDRVFRNLEHNLQFGNTEGFEYDQYFHMIKNLNYRLNHGGVICSYCGRGEVACDLDIGGNLYLCPNRPEPAQHILQYGIKPLGSNPYTHTTKCQSCMAYIYCGGGCSMAAPDRKEYECYVIQQQVSRLLKMLTNLCGGNT